MSLLRTTIISLSLILVIGTDGCDFDTDPVPVCDGHALGDQWEAADGCNTCI